MATPTKAGSGPVRPWEAYRRESSGEGQGRLQHKLTQPGWAGELTDDELQLIVNKLQADPALAYWWGFRPQTKRRPIDSVKSVALWGDPEVRAVNVKLARKPRAPDGG
jgi:hypothetical protein